MLCPWPVVNVYVYLRIVLENIFFPADLRVDECCRPMTNDLATIQLYRPPYGFLSIINKRTSQTTSDFILFLNIQRTNLGPSSIIQQRACTRQHAALALQFQPVEFYCHSEDVHCVYASFLILTRFQAGFLAHQLSPLYTMRKTCVVFVSDDLCRTFPYRLRRRLYEISEYIIITILLI